MTTKVQSNNIEKERMFPLATKIIAMGDVSMTNDLQKVKNNIKNKMNIENIDLFELSKKTNISVLKLIILLNFSFSRIKLSYAIKICEALKIQVSDIFI